MKIESILNRDNLKSLGIVDWGYTEEAVPRSLERYESWVDKGHHAPLYYLSDERFEKRKNLKNYFDEFESALVFLFDYSEEKQKLDNFYKGKESNGLKIASYVTGFNGDDYHWTIRERLELLKEKLTSFDIKCELTVDIHPVLERDLAYRSGLGWFGKNSMLINREHGSFVMIGSILLSKKLELNEREVETDHCGQCQACIEFCPTDAIDIKNRTIISNKCISTYTIELFKDDAEPPLGIEKSNGEVFGCDICQDVCPWNKRVFRKRNLDEEFDFKKSPKLLAIKELLTKPVLELTTFLEGLSNREYRRIYKGTPLERTGRVGFLKNLKIFR